MDLSVLSCLGPDFDHQTVFHLLSNHGRMESVVSSPCLKTNDLAHQSFSYVPRKRSSGETVDLRSNLDARIHLIDRSSRSTYGYGWPSGLIDTSDQVFNVVAFLFIESTESIVFIVGQTTCSNAQYRCPSLRNTLTVDEYNGDRPGRVRHRWRFDFFIRIDSFRRAMEIALLLKEHPDSSCVLVTLIQEYQSR